MSTTQFSTKDRILNAAEGLFAQQGFAGTSLREVTSRADVNIAAVNYHFGSKEKLITQAIRHLDRADKRRIDRRLHSYCLCRVKRLRLNSRPGAGSDKGLLKGEIVFRQGNKQAFRGFNAVASDAPEDAIFCDALFSGFAVGDGIAGAAVQQAVISSGRAGGNVMAFQQRHA